MTMSTFGLSAVFPGHTQGKRWDTDWTLPSVGFTWNDTIIPADANGYPSGMVATSESTGASTGSSVDVPIVIAPYQWEMDLFTGIRFTHSITTSNSVATDSYMYVPSSGSPVSYQEIMLDMPWNGIKDIEVSNLSAQVIHVSGFVDTWINTPADNASRDVIVDNAKRGMVSLGGGDDSVTVNLVSNEYGWSSHFIITAGDGNDTVVVQPQSYLLVDRLVAPSGWTFNSAPQLTTADITLGNGNDLVTLNEISGTIHVGSGTDTVHIRDGNTVVWLGSGSDTVIIGGSDTADAFSAAVDTQVGTATIHVGTGHADIIIDDTNAAMTPRVTIDFIHGQTGGSTFATADVIHYGHIDPASGAFVGGDLRALTIDLIGYGSYSTALTGYEPPGTPLLLQIHDSNAARGSTDAVAIYGTPITGPTQVWFT